MFLSDGLASFTRIAQAVSLITVTLPPSSIYVVEFGKDASFLLFTICIEFLAIAIRNDLNLEGISILNCDAEKEIKISLYADDNTLLPPGKEEALHQAIGIFNKFWISSGLTLNLSVCEVLRIGSLRNSNAPLCSELNLRWANHNVSALGAVFSTNENTVIKLNYELQLVARTRPFSNWKNSYFESISYFKIGISFQLTSKSRWKLFLWT